MDTGDTSQSSTTTPSFGGSSSSSSGGSGGSGGGDLGIQQDVGMTSAQSRNAVGSPMQSVEIVNEIPGNLPRINIKPEESVGSFDTPRSLTEDLFSRTPSQGTFDQMTRQSRNRVDTTIDVQPTAGDTIDVQPSASGTLDVQPTVDRTIDVNPSSKKGRSVKTERINTPNSRGSSSSVNQLSNEENKFYKMELDRIKQSIDYIENEAVMTQSQRNKTRKKMQKEADALFASLNPNARKAPKHLNKIIKHIESQLSSSS